MDMVSVIIKAQGGEESLFVRLSEFSGVKWLLME